MKMVAGSKSAHRIAIPISGMTALIRSLAERFLDRDRVFFYYPKRFTIIRIRNDLKKNAFLSNFSMGKPTPPQSVKLVASLLWREERAFEEALRQIVARWGAVDFISERLEFTYSDYYEREMGSNLWRRIVSFETLISPDSIPAVKHVANEIEVSLSAGSNGRSVNIDPGYLNAYHLILATTKSCPHRPYLQQGIYADLTLIYREKGFCAFPWTYPDYRSDTITAIMTLLRQKYLFQLRRGLSPQSRG